MYIYLPVTDAYIKCRYSNRMLSQYLSDAMKQLFLWLFLGKSNTMLCLFSASWICAHAGLIYITAHYILATVRKKTQKSGHLILRFLHDTCSSTLSAATMHGTSPSCHYTPPRHKWTASEWEERSRRPYLVSDSARDASKPHKLLLNVCQWYRIGYCWIFNSLTVVWCHCLSAPVCLLAFSPPKYIHHTTHLSLEGERLGWWRKAAVKEA